MIPLRKHLTPKMAAWHSIVWVSLDILMLLMWKDLYLFFQVDMVGPEIPLVAFLCLLLAGYNLFRRAFYTARLWDIATNFTVLWPVDVPALLDVDEILCAGLLAVGLFVANLWVGLTPWLYD